MTEILNAIRAGLPEVAVEIVPNTSPCGQHGLLVERKDGRAVAEFLKNTLGFDFCSNVSGIDWPARKIKETLTKKELVEGVEKEVKTTIEREVPGFLEVVYHLFSMTKKTGLVTLRMRTGDRVSDVSVPSLTPVWKSADFQEREAFDLFGIHFSGHPDLRRILMWEEFTDHPMRKDYVAPDDYDYEPTPHDEILNRVKARTGGA
jgi:NADH-quinone oxidoreductase subunit C